MIKFDNDELFARLDAAGQDLIHFSREAIILGENYVECLDSIKTPEFKLKLEESLTDVIENKLKPVIEEMDFLVKNYKGVAEALTLADEELAESIKK